MESTHLSRLFLNMVLFGNISFLFPPQKSHIFLLLPPQELHSPILANKPDLLERTCTDHNNFNHKASCTLTWATSAPAGSYHIRKSYSRLLTLPSKTFSCTSFIIINKNHNIQNAMQPACGSYNMSLQTLCPIPLNPQTTHAHNLKTNSLHMVWLKCSDIKMQRSKTEAANKKNCI